MTNAAMSGLPESIQSLFHRLVAEAMQLGETQQIAVPSGVLMARTRNYMSLKPRQERVDVEVLLAHEVKAPAVYRTFQVSKHLWANYVRIQSQDEITPQLQQWIREAWELAEAG